MLMQNKFRATVRTPGVSTTDIIVRILQNYEDYVDRYIKQDNVAGGSIRLLRRGAANGAVALGGRVLHSGLFLGVSNRRI